MHLDTVAPIQTVHARNPGEPAPSIAKGTRSTATTDVKAELPERNSDALTRELAPPAAPPGPADPEKNNGTENPLIRSLVRNTRFKLSFHVDEATEQVVISVIDPETEELIRQVPPEEMLRLAEQLERVRGSFFSSRV